MQYNTEQLEAINHTDGPALIIAGPGSGKTSVLTARIRHLILNKGVMPEQILVITFSKAAAIEMQTRFNNLCKENFYPVNFGTFHSVFFHILQNEYHYTAKNIISLKQKRNTILSILRNLNIVQYAECELLDNLINAISYYKNTNCKTIPDIECNISKEQFLDIFNEYTDILKSNDFIDFEDMMIEVKRLFVKNSAALLRYRERFKYILIDEYQDINEVQFEIVKMLAYPLNNLWVCGDDDQSLYRFRGGSPELMLSFKNIYPNARIVKLSVNYRSTEQIIDCAAKMIGENKTRFDKQIVGIGRRGKDVQIIANRCMEEENQRIIKLIKSQIESNNHNSIAILTRTNRENAIYAELLAKNEIEFSMKEKVVNPYNSAVFKDFAHYISLAECLDELPVCHLFPIMNKPSRYLSRKNIITDKITFDRLRQMSANRPYMKNVIDTFEYQIRNLSKMDLYSQINYIRKGIRYDDYVKSNLTVGGQRYEDYVMLADMIQAKSREFNSLSDFITYCEEYEEMLNSKRSIDNNSNMNIMTYHAAKGLEFDMVILPHINEGSVPNKRSIGIEQIEEERRMFYVAMTRAKNELYISYVKGDKDNRILPSRFLYSLVKSID